MTVGTYLSLLNDPLMSADDERRLGALIQAGIVASALPRPDDHQREAIIAGQRAKDEFVRRNLRLVVSVAKKYPSTPGVEFDDIVQAGNIGLIRAVEKFDPSRGFKFSTYAAFWIRQAIQRFFEKNDLIHLPSGAVSGVRSSLRHGVELSDSQKQIEQSRNVLSLNSTVDDDGLELGDLLSSPDDTAASAQTSVLANQAIALLSQKGWHGQAALLRFGLVDGTQWTFTAIGEHLGYTTEAVRSGVMRAINELSRDFADD